ncbi:hypothetical protein EYF80_032722 [Liparis tanakae]|uniref:Uncharacterized protein n=1 Tax=Liparis tanakae TaxID=230148 RepID=A0A4Z2GTX0_9TELE|nr:hypothetical protein EYF80_032722 [Liparis tanakae]
MHSSRPSHSEEEEEERAAIGEEEEPSARRRPTPLLLSCTEAVTIGVWGHEAGNFSVASCMSVASQQLYDKELFFLCGFGRFLFLFLYLFLFLFLFQFQFQFLFLFLFVNCCQRPSGNLRLRSFW